METNVLERIKIATIIIVVCHGYALKAPLNFSYSFIKIPKAKRPKNPHNKNGQTIASIDINPARITGPKVISAKIIPPINANPNKKLIKFLNAFPNAPSTIIITTIPITYTI